MNKVVDVLSRKNLLLCEIQINSVGFEGLKKLYIEDANFKEAYEACLDPICRNNEPWMDYIIPEGLLFKGNNCVSLEAL